MTLSRERVLSLSADELRVAIAFLKDYHWYEEGTHAFLVNTMGRYMLDKRAQLVDEPDPDLKKIYRCPDWPGDIRAMYALEGELTPTQKYAYVVELFRIACGYEGESETFIRMSRGLDDDQYFSLVHATAEQRARAWYLVRTEGG